MRTVKLSNFFSIVTAVVVVVGIVAAAGILYSKKDEGAPQHSATSRTDDAGPTITFTDHGFDPTTYEFPVGTAIRVVNDSKMSLEFSSGSHPTHREHPELNLDILKPGESGSFTPAGKGSYSFHDHLHDQYTGTLEVR